jgi:N-dimethylarginine dimethylaminohydrolase
MPEGMGSVPNGKLTNGWRIASTCAIPLAHDDPYLYHLDCSVFPMTGEDTLVCTELYDRAALRPLERETNIIDVSYDTCFSGICNSVRLGNTIINASHINEMRSGTTEYIEELDKNRRLEDIATELAFEVTTST